MTISILRYYISPLSMRCIARYYNTNVHDHFNNPRNVGSFSKKEKNIGTAIVGKAACGDVIKLQIKVINDVIVDSKFKTFGCGSAIASSSYVTELIKGKHINDVINIKNTDISNYLKLPPVKIHCSLLAEESVKHSIIDYIKKKK